MAYLKIDGVDYSMFVNELAVNSGTNYSAQTNAAGNTVVDFINHKREIEVGIIPLDDKIMQKLQTAINAFNVSISFRDPKTNALETINCIVPNSNVQYYTIQAGKIMYNAFTIKFIEL